MTSMIVLSYSISTRLTACITSRKSGRSDGAVGIEGDVARHHERDLVAGADDADAGALEEFSQLRVLVVHVSADRSTAQDADAGPDHGRLGGVLARERRDARGDAGPDAATEHAADRRLADALLARVRIRDTAGRRGQYEAADERAGERADRPRADRRRDRSARVRIVSEEFIGFVLSGLEWVARA